MNDATPPDRRVRAGLCDDCAHRQLITSARGSVFVLCRLALADPAFPKYPPLPVTRCSGYEPAGPSPH